MKEKIKNKEHEKNTFENRGDPRSEFRDLIDMGAYRSLTNNEFFQNLHPDEQVNAMHSALEKSLELSNQRFGRMVSNRPNLAAEYRDQKIKPLRNAIQALDQIALETGEITDFSTVIQDEAEIFQRELEEAA